MRLQSHKSSLLRPTLLPGVFRDVRSGWYLALHFSMRVHCDSRQPSTKDFQRSVTTLVMPKPSVRANFYHAWIYKCFNVAALVHSNVFLAATAMCVWRPWVAHLRSPAPIPHGVSQTLASPPLWPSLPSLVPAFVMTSHRATPQCGSRCLQHAGSNLPMYHPSRRQARLWIACEGTGVSTDGRAHSSFFLQCGRRSPTRV